MFICYIVYTLYIRNWEVGSLPDICEALSLISRARGKENIYGTKKRVTRTLKNIAKKIIVL